MPTPYALPRLDSRTLERLERERWALKRAQAADLEAGLAAGRIPSVGILER